MFKSDDRLITKINYDSIIAARITRQFLVKKRMVDQVKQILSVIETDRVDPKFKLC